MWLAPPDPAPPFLGAPTPFHVAIAIPARDEAASIGGCLAAIEVAAARAAAWLASLTVVVSANNCSDDTAAVASAFPARRINLQVHNVQLDPGDAHAGGARRAALECAARLLPADGILATTDADSNVAHDWLEALLGAFAQGADAVAGAITLDDSERRRLPALAGRDAEWRLAGLLAALEDRLDPRPHDPAPRHIWAWGANLALTLRAYRLVGGLPAVPLAEDRALADRLLGHDLRLRRSTAPLVYTSARISGRAPGGFADLIRGFADDSELPCDAALEPVASFILRLRWRARLRAIFRTGGSKAAVAAAQPLLPPAFRLVDSAYFGVTWAAIEQAAPLLERRRLYPQQLEGELRSAELALVRLSRPPGTRLRRSAGNRSDSPRGDAAS